MRKDLHKFIVDRMKAYPSIFPTGGEVLHHIFIVTGNGYDWEKDEGGNYTGNIVNTGYLLLEEKENRYKDLDTFREYLNDILDLRDRKVSIEEYAKARYEEDKKIIDNAETLALDLHLNDRAYRGNEDINPPNFGFYPMSEYSMIFHVPDNVSDMWKDGIRCMYKILNDRLCSEDYLDIVKMSLIEELEE